MGKSLSKVVWFDPGVFNHENIGVYNKLSELIEVQRFDKREETINFVL